MSHDSRPCFVHRGVTAYQSADESHPVRWAAEIKRDRAFEFIRAETAADLVKKIDKALERHSSN
jgi:hypothetical protein